MSNSTNQLIKDINNAKQGDEESFRRIYHLYIKRITGTLKQILDLSNIDDGIQEVFIRIWKGLSNMKQPEYFSTWVYKITWNVALDMKKKSKNMKLDFFQDHSKAYESIAKEQSCPQTRVINQRLVQGALAYLDFDHRSVFVLAELEELPLGEVSKVMSIPLGTVKSRLFNARKNMRTFLESHEVKYEQ